MESKFVTVHSGVTRGVFEKLRREGRVTDIVSRGGAFLVVWMLYNKKENPLYGHFDTLLELAKEYDLVLSLGDGFRPGSIADSTDRAQVEELIILGELQKRAMRAGVQCMIEGPGHIPINEVEASVLLEKKLCHNAAHWDLELSKARKRLDWESQIELSINPELSRKIRKERKPGESDVCTMCGKYCAIKLLKEALEG
jgi:phosphomethylpyrimidine synthase